MPKQQLLIIDDEPDMLQGLQRVLNYELQEVDVLACSKPQQALSLLQGRNSDLVLLDIRMPDVDGLELLRKMKELDPGITVIMMTAYGSIEVAVQAIKQGAYDFICKPFQMQDLIRMLRKGLERNRLIQENTSLRRHISGDSGLKGLVGRSRAMQGLFETIRSVAATDYAVLIRGESGTGKELVARAIHSLSKRGGRNLVTVNCPAIPEHLLEGELFGHKKGAFTGALQDRKGLFEEAHASSLLLDEIADIPVTVQTKLLRFLQEQEFRPLGRNQNVRVDVRILSTTNQDLEQKLANKSFREDLFYRLNVFSIKTPSLKEVKEDIPLLVNYFHRRFCLEQDKDCKQLQFSAQALDLLMQKQWPGNVRELQNFVRRIILLNDKAEITSRDILAAEGRGPETEVWEQQIDDQRVEPYNQGRQRVLHDYASSYAQNILQKTGGNISRAARLAGLSRVALQKILRRTGVDPRQYRGG
ncbi:MAG: sigma-54-dependent transcriptional regulator [Thermodesulfobacteriota bacterium]